MLAEYSLNARLSKSFSGENKLHLSIIGIYDNIQAVEMNLVKL
jgi:hypothetical protein